MTFSKSKISSKTGFLILFFTSILALLLIFGTLSFYKIDISLPTLNLPPKSGSLTNIAKFSSQEDFKIYLSKVEEFSEFLTFNLPAFTEERALAQPSPISSSLALPERISQTTVQVPGIDEPDIVKTDGKEIYFSPGRTWPIWREPATLETIIPPSSPKLKIIKAFPPENLSLENEIDKSGDLLLIKEKNILVVFTPKEIFAFNISEPKNPKEIWKIKLDENNHIVTSRLYRGKIYLVSQNLINELHPCPIKPLTIKDRDIEIQCQEIFHPVLPVPIDVTFLAMVLNPETGEIEKKIPFVGSSGASVVYMSESSLYITYTFNEDLIKFYAGFLKEKAKDLLPKEILEKIEKLATYDISQQAKFYELVNILQRYYLFLNEDEKLKIRNEMNNRILEYLKERVRDLEKTGIVKINLDKFEIEATGFVPGFPLNQFALDEYQNNLRIAVTVGERFFGFGFGPQTESLNDVYVLDPNLKIIGKIQNLGLGERIYSVRFIQDKGYLVTFRQTDPFFVLDLSDPKNPQLKGQLKIPGYSSYLHEISKNEILGIGKEEWRVKISIFDVSDPQNPKEKEKYILDESWSDILNTHHAFLLDPKHQIFFLPGSKGGYIFSFSEGKLKLVKAISQPSTKRALYLDDYLYLISDKKITVLNENTWEKIKELEM